MTIIMILAALLYGLLGGFLFRLLRERRAPDFSQDERRALQTQIEQLEQYLTRQEELAEAHLRVTKDRIKVAHARAELAAAEVAQLREKVGARPATVAAVPSLEEITRDRAKQAVLNTAVDRIQSAAKEAGFNLTLQEAMAEARRVLVESGMEGFGDGG